MTSIYKSIDDEAIPVIGEIRVKRYYLKSGNIRYSQYEWNKCVTCDVSRWIQKRKHNNMICKNCSKSRKHKKWSKNEEDYFRSLFYYTKLKDIAMIFNTSFKEIYAKSDELGLVRSKEIVSLRKIRSNRQRSRNRVVSLSLQFNFLDSISGFRRCNDCNAWKLYTEYQKNPKLNSGLHSYCRNCQKNRASNWYNGMNDSYKTSRSTRAQSIEFEKKMFVMEYLCSGPPHCICCDEDAVVFLTIDHIVPARQNSHKRKDGKIIRYLYKQINIKNTAIKNVYQVLCFNCNMAKGDNSNCPHQMFLNNKT